MTLRVAAAIGLLLWLHGLEDARAACREDADCGLGQHCLATKGSCEGSSGAASTCIIKACTSGPKEPRPHPFHHGWAGFACNAPNAGYLEVSYVWKGVGGAPDRLLAFALASDPVAQATSGKTVRVDSRRALAPRLAELQPGCEPTRYSPCPVIRGLNAEVESLIVTLRPDRRRADAGISASIDLRLKGEQQGLSGMIDLEVTEAQMRLANKKCR